MLYEGDLYLVDLKSSTARRLTQTPTEERDPAFSADGKRVFFIREGLNVMAMDLDSPRIEQLTDIRAVPAPAPTPKPDPQRALLEAQQKELFAVVRDRARADSVAKAEREASEAARPKVLHLMADERVTGLSVSPNGRALLLTTTIRTPSAKQTIVPNYVTLSGYTEDMVVRTKVGDAQAAAASRSCRSRNGTVSWLRPIPTDTVRAPGLVAALGWNDAGSDALVVAEARDYKTRVPPPHRRRLGHGCTTLDVAARHGVGRRAVLPVRRLAPRQRRSSGSSPKPTAMRTSTR